MIRTTCYELFNISPSRYICTTYRYGTDCTLLLPFWSVFVRTQLNPNPGIMAGGLHPCTRRHSPPSHASMCHLDHHEPCMLCQVVEGLSAACGLGGPCPCHAGYAWRCPFTYERLPWMTSTHYRSTVALYCRVLSQSTVSLPA